MLMKIYESITTIQILEEVCQMLTAATFNNLDDSFQMCKLIISTIQ